MSTAWQHAHAQQQQQQQQQQQRKARMQDVDRSDVLSQVDDSEDGLTPRDRVNVVVADTPSPMYSRASAPILGQTIFAPGNRPSSPTLSEKRPRGGFGVLAGKGSINSSFAGRVAIPPQNLQIQVGIEEVSAGAFKATYVKEEGLKDADRHPCSFTIKLVQSKTYRFNVLVRNSNEEAVFENISVNGQLLSNFHKLSFDGSICRMSGESVFLPEANPVTARGERSMVEVKLIYRIGDVPQPSICFKLQCKMYAKKGCRKHMWGRTCDHVVVLTSTREGVQEERERAFFVPGSGARRKPALSHAFVCGA
eukprot:tig00001366_g8382.t1